MIWTRVIYVCVESVCCFKAIRSFSLVLNRNMATDHDYCLLIIDGYMREESELLKLNIPYDIHKLIYMFYKEITRYFDQYNKELFKTENDNKRIIPIGPAGWDSELHMIFPSPNGFRVGLHKWAIKYVKLCRSGNASTRSIGVTSKITQKCTSRQVNWNDADGSHNCYWAGRGKWRPNETIEVILNLKAFKVEFYRIIEGYKSKDDIMIIKLKEDILKPDTTYYFALYMDSDHKCGVFECVLPKTNC